MAKALLTNLGLRKRRLLQFLLLGGAIAGGALVVVGQEVPPLVDLATEPLYMNGAKTKANLSIALSVEFPTVGQTYRDEFDATKEYVGYFDPKSCYKTVDSSGSLGSYFDWTGNVNGSGSCGGGGYSGNFMNWATSSAIDILRYGLTGGNRVVDEGSGNHRTIVERAWLPDDFYNHSSYFGVKKVTRAAAKELVETALWNKIPDGQDLYIYNCKNRVYFAKASAADSTGNCDSPYGTSVTAGTHPNLIGANNNQRFYEVRNLVCDPNSASNRLMSYDPATKQWKGLCKLYPSKKYKPVGQFQVNSESLRVAVFGYLNDDLHTRYGGVLRSPMKYLGPKAFDQNFNLIAGTNPRREWDETTGVFIDNPQAGDGTYGDQGYSRSGAIMYINKFGTLHTAGDYKTHDPVTELYYEVLRYLQGKQPTSAAVTSVPDTRPSGGSSLTESYPVYKTWTDPFTGFQDTTAPEAGSCLRNSILAIADVFTHRDLEVPGNTRTSDGDSTRAAATNPDLDAYFWTKVVGGFEANQNISYTDSRGRLQNTRDTNSAITGNRIYDSSYKDSTGTTRSLANLDNQVTGANSGSYAMAGLAYWANTQSFNPTYPKARVRTFTIDVNEKRSSDAVDFRRTRQLYLAAKYGGFDDRQADQTGNPYQPGTNILWQGTDGDAQNYFLVSDAKKFLDSLAEVFARVVEETGSIAGGAISTTRLTANETASVYQARFNPVANYWSGRLLKMPISVSTTGSVTLGTTPVWEAGDKLTERTRADQGVGRNIIIGPPVGEQGTTNPAEFKWSSLPLTHQTAFNTFGGVNDGFGEDRVNWLRGDQTKEQSARNPAGLYRPRDIVLGDIVNSGIVYVGKPNLATGGDDFKSFYDAHKNRRSVLYVNANDGMLHGFYDDDGSEAFAYVPGFLAPKMSVLPDQDYMHISLADATPAIADAKINGSWKTVLVSGVGGGGQGVFALDVSDPSAFGTTKALWEFTDRDHPALGNVLGPPQILKFRVSSATATTPTYKYYAVVASGVNNNAPDGRAYTPNDTQAGNASLFFLDLGFNPASGWQEGVNFWRIELPQTVTTMAKGIVSFSAVKNAFTGSVDALYGGDLQGNLWKLDFSIDGTTSLGTDAAANFRFFNKVTGDAPMYVALNASGQRQPITGEPVVVNAFGGQKIISFGTGKFLEVNDTTVPLVPAASFYSILDGGFSPITGRSVLAAATLNTSTGDITTPAFVWGTSAGTQKAGWYLDFDSAIGERQISDITSFGSQLIFGTIFPTKGSCGEGGGRIVLIDPLIGKGISEESQVGVLAPPLVYEIGPTTKLSVSDTAGRRRLTQTAGYTTQGAKGMKVGGKTTTNTYIVGRMSWRQINNYQYEKNKP